MTELPPTLEYFKDINLEQLVWDELLAEIKEQHDDHLNAVILHPEVYKYLTRKSHKKIKRRLYYDVTFYYDGKLESHYFESAKKMRKFVNSIHELLSVDVPCVRIEKTWCYREHQPKHKWYYVSFYPNQFVCVEKY